jgi:hypothetical protein
MSIKAGSKGEENASKLKIFSFYRYRIEYEVRIITGISKSYE